MSKKKLAHSNSRFPKAQNQKNNKTKLNKQIGNSSKRDFGKNVNAEKFIKVNFG